MSIANTILDAVKTARQASAEMIEFYYDEGVISRKDLEIYTDYLVKTGDDLEYRLTTIFGVCEARLQVKKGKE